PLWAARLGESTADRPVAGDRLRQARGGSLLLMNVDALAQPEQQALAALLAAEDATPKKPAQAVRIMATTSSALRDDALRRSRFSHRLLRQLGGVPIHVPPLRERLEDIPLMIAHLTCAMRNRYGVDLRFSSAALECLTRYRWPGNQQEMLTLLHELAASRRSRLLEPTDLPPVLQRAALARRGARFEPQPPRDAHRGNDPKATG
ncbi:MAG: hypothetical protein AAGD86_12100, partial [Pseudomonadota bacterium]